MIKAAKKVYRRLKLAKQRREEVNAGKQDERIAKADVADRRRQGFSWWDSFCYDLKYTDYREYISTWEGWQPERSKSPYFKVSGDKYLFACVFGPHIAVPPTYALIENGELFEINCPHRDLYDLLLEVGGVLSKTGMDITGIT